MGDVRWSRALGGDTECTEDGWRAYPPEWAEQAEPLFQAFLSSGGAERSHCRRVKISTGDGRESSVDFLLLTSVDPPGRDGKSRVLPLRRFEGGFQTHPRRGQPHPWFLKRVADRDSSDWLNNDFFFRAFSQVMGESGHRVEASVHDIFDFRWNQDFRGREEAEPTVRGGVMYTEPVGWKKFAIRVMNCFEGGNAWLRLDGSPGEWAVAYHGTNVQAMPSILTGGMRVGERQAYKDFRDSRTGERIGEGIYCTPSMKTAADFAPVWSIEGRKLQFVFQCRVRPEAIKRIHEEVGRESGAYWLINDPSDIRPYGVLVREVETE
mmetsp:Transcript_40783/g.118156  ORF Transcript_40783/g.118156 Transcript_40783/m.118156 type:complete len:322 (+) Transcript_40783:57-1022(+)